MGLHRYTWATRQRTYNIQKGLEKHCEKNSGFIIESGSEFCELNQGLANGILLAVFLSHWLLQSWIRFVGSSCLLITLCGSLHASQWDECKQMITWTLLCFGFFCFLLPIFNKTLSSIASAILFATSVEHPAIHLRGNTISEINTTTFARFSTSPFFLYKNTFSQLATFVFMFIFNYPFHSSPRSSNHRLAFCVTATPTSDSPRSQN
jgi:hypothetical protein